MITATQFTVDRMPSLVAAAAADDHCVLYPTEVFEKNGEIVGYVSVFGMPIVNVWLDSKKVTARDSLYLLGRMNQGIKAKGIGSYVMPCAEISPFYPKMDKLGFSKLGSTTLFYKEF